MKVFGRVIGLSVLAGFLGAGLSVALFGQSEGAGFPCFVLGCVGGVVGAIAGGAREIALAVRDK